MDRNRWVTFFCVFVAAAFVIGGLIWYLMLPVTLKGSGGDISMPRAAEVIPEESYVNGYFMEDFGSFFPETKNLSSISCTLSGKIEKGDIRIVFVDDTGKKFKEVKYISGDSIDQKFTFKKPEKGIVANAYSSKDAVFSLHYSFSAEIRRIDQ